MPSKLFDAAMYDFPLLHGWYSDSMEYDSCDNGSPSEDIWHKFNLTPPLSPTQEGINEFEDSNIHRDHCPVDDDLSDTILQNLPPTLPDIKDACSEVFNKEQSITDCFSKIRKDCMWNGSTTDSSVLPSSHRRNRSISPASFSCSPVSSGCIDPRSLFNFNKVNDRAKQNRSSRRFSVSGPETPSDSDEEVDVVTVEKKSIPLKSVTNLALFPNGSKLFSTLVQQNGTQSHLALISPNKSQSEPTKNTKTVSMIFTNGEKKNLERKTFHLKCLPVASSPGQMKSKRKLSSDKPHVFQVMKLTPTSMSPQKSPASVKKRKFVSLNGVSMVSDTGIKKNVSINSSLEHNLNYCTSQSPTNCLTAQLINTDKSTAKTSSLSDEDSPTSSPQSSEEETLNLPKKRSRINRATNSSSGSEEESTRVAHNYLERQRRQSLRNLYHKLREVVPEVATVEKAAKVNILKKAKDYVIELQQKNDELLKTKTVEQQKGRFLQHRLKNLAEELVSFRNTSLL